MEEVCKTGGISSVRGVRLVKAALEAGLRLGEVRCLQCDSLLVDDFPRPWIEWNEMLERCLHEG